LSLVPVVWIELEEAMRVARSTSAAACLPALQLLDAGKLCRRSFVLNLQGL